MKKLGTPYLLVAFLFGLASFAFADHHIEEGTWTGIVTDTKCGEKGAKADHAACAARCVKRGEAKYALYNAADKGVYVLSNQEEAGKMAGQEVTVRGKLNKESKEIEVSSIEPAAKK